LSESRKIAPKAMLPIQSNPASQAVGRTLILRAPPL
jgi:hypothetical protein